MTADFRPLSGTKTAPEAGAPSIEAGGYGPVWLLAVGQTVGYCGLYYIYAALLPDWEATLGWSKATLAVGPTLAILLSALLAPVIGRLVDGGHGGTVLVAGPLIGAAALLALAFVTTPLQFALGWAVIGLAQAMSFYEACFSYLTRVFGAGARPAITRVTLVAGFASTITFPAAAMLVHLTDWRGAVIGFALALALVAAPANLLGSRCLRDQGAGRLRESGMGLKPAMVRREFWLLALIFGLLYLDHGILLTYVLPIFADRGVGTGLAVAAAACIGPAQVGARLLLLVNERVSTGWTARASIVSMGLAAVVLLAAGVAPVLVFGFALLQGGAMGVVSILRPVLTAEVLGRVSFGAVSGAMAMAPLLAGAAAPFLGAGLIAAVGVPGLIWATIAMMGLALAAALALRRSEG